MGTTYLMPADNERLVKLIRFFELAGTPLQIKNAELAASLEMPVQAVSRFVKWAERYGVLEVTRTANGFAGGRVPNTYTLLMTLEQWREQGPTIVASMRVKPPVEKATKSLPSADAGDTEMARAVRPAADALVREALADAPPVEPLEPMGPMSDAEVDHWRSIEG